MNHQSIITEDPRQEIVKETFEEYRRFPALNQSALARADIQNGGCPAACAHYITTALAGSETAEAEAEETTEALAFGKLYHLYALQPEEFANHVHILDRDRQEAIYQDALANGSKAKGFSKNLANYRTWVKEMESKGKQVISEGLAGKLAAMRKSIDTNPEARHAITTAGINEVSIYWSIPLDPRDESDPRRIQCKALLDKIPNDSDRIIDLKTVRSAHPDEFARSVPKYSYDKQAAWYRRAARALDLGDRTFHFLCQEKTAPYLTAVHTMPQSWIDYADIELNNILTNIRTCLKSDNWPGHPGGELLPPPYLQDIIDAVA